MKLTDFLLDRIAEDKASATIWGRTGRELAECEARRRIVERHKRRPVFIPKAPDDCTCGRSVWPCTADDLRDLAFVYVSHPDYREEWRP